MGGDTNGQVDAFVKKIKSGAPKRLRPRGAQPKTPATAVAVSGNCKLIAFVQGGKLYVSKGGRPAKRVGNTRAPPRTRRSAPASGTTSCTARAAACTCARTARAGRGSSGAAAATPVYNDIKRQTVAYEKKRGGHWQIAYHDLGKRERIISATGGSATATRATR